MIRTLRERWNLGAPLTARDADAADIAPVLTLDEPRAPEDWPDVTPQPVPEFDEALIPLDPPLSPLAQAFVSGSLALAKQLGPIRAGDHRPGRAHRRRRARAHA